MAANDNRATKKLKSEQEAEAEEEEYSYTASQHIQFHLQSTRDQSSKPFHPEFTYHALGPAQKLIGYQDIEIQIYFNGQTMQAYVQIDYRKSHLSKEALWKKLIPSLPKNPIVDSTEFQALVEESSTNFCPPGEQVDQYHVNEREFVVFKCVLKDDKQMRQLHERMQMLALWFIEGADGIDLEDPRWSVYTLYEKLASSPTKIAYQIAGYITVFTFHTPLLGGNQQTTTAIVNSERICQALILPPYQQQGHCQRLVTLIMQRAQKNPQVYQVTVEDPVPAFSSLRDRIDVQQCLEHRVFEAHEPTSSLSPEAIVQVQTKLKMTKSQVQKCYEIIKWQDIDRANEEQYKAYRLQIKRRLFRDDRYQYEAIENTVQRKTKLQEDYLKLEQYYTSILSRVNARPPLRTSLKH